MWLQHLLMKKPKFLKILDLKPRGMLKIKIRGLLILPRCGSRLSSSRWGVRLSLSARVCLRGRESSFCTQSFSLVCHSLLSSSQRRSDHSAPSHKCVLVTVFSWVGHRAFSVRPWYSVSTLIRGTLIRGLNERRGESTTMKSNQESLL